MRWTVVAVFGIVAACSKAAPPKQQQSTRPPAIVNSATIGASDDSVLASSRSDTVVTTNGDTLVSFGGVMINDSTAHDWGIDHYAKNGNHFLRVEQMTARRPDGKPIWAVIARLPLPHVKALDDVAIDGLCDQNGKHDPLIFGVTGEPVSSFRYQAVRAWRVEPTSKIVREIPADSVTCAHVIGED